MSKQAFVKTTDGFLAPIGEPVKAYLSMAAGDEIVLPVKMQRNPKYHRLFFSWLNAVYQNQDRYETLEKLRLSLLLRTGRVKEVITKTLVREVNCIHCGKAMSVQYSKTAFTPESMSFENMSEDEFQSAQKDFDKILLEDGINIEMGQH